MIVAIHQPNYLPWLGYFYKIARCDLFVLLRNIEYSKNGYINRCKIKTSQGEQWMTVGMAYKNKSKQSIDEMEMADSQWNKIHQRTLQMNYARSQWFKTYLPFLQTIYDQPWNHISQLNETFIRLICRLLGLTTSIVSDTDLCPQGQGTERLVNICMAVGATTYLSGVGGKNYMNEALFAKHSIKLEYSDFQHPVYQQLWGQFIPDLSIVDLLFNEGKRSLGILMGGQK